MIWITDYSLPSCCWQVHCKKRQWETGGSDWIDVLYMEVMGNSNDNLPLDYINMPSARHLYFTLIKPDASHSDSVPKMQSFGKLRCQAWYREPAIHVWLELMELKGVYVWMWSSGCQNGNCWLGWPPGGLEQKVSIDTPEGVCWWLELSLFHLQGG